MRKKNKVYPREQLEEKYAENIIKTQCCFICCLGFIF